MLWRWLLAACAVSCEPVAGLIGRFGDGATNVVFESRTPNFYLEAGESVHPALGTQFRGQWEGSLQVLAAGAYEFNRAVTLDGVTGAKHTLTAGMHRLVIPFVRGAGVAQLRLEWKGAGFDWEPVPRAAFFHEAVSDAAEAGRKLAAEARCGSCHSLGVPVTAVPRLEGIGSRTNANWLYAYLGKHGGADVSQRADLAAWLAGLRSVVVPKARKANEVEIGKGGELFGTMGCVFCHPSGTMGAMGSKYTLPVLTAVLLDRHRPSMMLSEGDATAIAAHLTRSTDKDFENTAPAGDMTKGLAAASALGCVGCHEQRQSLAAPRSADCRVVKTPWTAEEKESVAVFLRRPAMKSDAPVFNVRYELERQRCGACHKPGTEAPELDGAGEKLKTSWIGKVLWGKERIRHGRELRMPDYGEAEMKSLAVALAKMEGVAPGDGAAPPVFGEMVRETGIGLLGTNSKKQGMACIGCHDWGANKALGEEGPQLQNAATRLRFEWYERWMKNPARILSGTSMPNYFGSMAVERARPRMRALWAAMEWGVKGPAPDGFRVSDLAVTSEARPVAGKTAMVVRWDMPEATPAAIAVGLPGGVSYCFDAGRSQLLYAWRGGFVDMTGTLLRKTDEKRFTPTAAIVGTVFWRAGKAEGTRKFKGYRLVNGFPEFRYFVGGVEVRELLTPEGDGIRRKIVTGSDVKEEVLR
ncbi:MAG: hypothetical protein HYX27_09390 [Acidobacteria bacterium]|nr:hypothetical protein [Acidobacteriota bacterium]